MDISRDRLRGQRLVAHSLERRRRRITAHEAALHQLDIPEDGDREARSILKD
jgi:hypothetical protein